MLLCAAALVAGCSSESAGGADAFPSAAYATVASDSGALNLEVRTAPDQPPSRGTASVEYRISTHAGAPQDGLDLTVLPFMPSMGHGASGKPTVSAKGDGRYVISGVELFMAGHWELRTDISGAVKDHAAPSFDVP
jgi:hypothetical protein